MPIFRSVISKDLLKKLRILKAQEDCSNWAELLLKLCSCYDTLKQMLTSDSDLKQKKK